MLVLLPFISDIHLKEPVGIAESLHNLSLVKDFCTGHLPANGYIFTAEDLLYASDSIKPSLLAFLTQLFHYFFLAPLDIVKPRVKLSGK